MIGERRPRRSVSPASHVSVMPLIKPGTRRKGGPSQTIVRLASAPSRRFALLRPRCSAANGLDRAVRQPHAAIVDGPREQRLHWRARRLANLCLNLLTTHFGSTIVKSSSAVAHRNPLRVARCGAHGSPAPGHDPISSPDSFPGCSSAWPYVCGSGQKRMAAVAQGHSARSSHSTLAHALNTSGAHVPDLQS